MPVTLSGRQAFDASLEHAAKELDDLQPAHDQAGALVVRSAKPRAPRRSGRLAGSLHSAGAPGEATIEATAPYAVPVHAGVPSRHIKAHPFITDTATRIQPAWTDIYAADVQRVLDTVKGA